MGSEFTTDSIQVVKNSVKWPKPIKIDCEVPIDPSKRETPLRLSFRFENASGSGFTRLGIVEISVTNLILNSENESQKIHQLLTNCKYNTYFDATVEIQDERNKPKSIDRNSVQASVTGLLENEYKSVSVKSLTTTSTTTGGTSVTFNSVINPLFDSCPVKITHDKFNQFEKQIDEILAQVITDPTLS